MRGWMIRCAMVGMLVVASCARERVKEPVLAGARVEDAGAAKEWKEGEQEATGGEGQERAHPGSEGMRDGGGAEAVLSGAGLSEVKEPTPQPPPSGRGSKEVFPFVRVDVERKVVEFDAQVPAYSYVPEGGVVYLEVVVCTRDTREHEAVLVTPARASDVHAALLMAGLVPGAPGGWEWEEKTIKPIAPRGEAVDVVFVLERDGKEVEEAAGAWVYNVATGQTLEKVEGAGFVFAGSGFITRGGGERYAADGAGTLVGLATFGTETIAWQRVFSPESGVDEPVWAVRRDVQPPMGTRVVVRVKKRSMMR